MPIPLPHSHLFQPYYVMLHFTCGGAVAKRSTCCQVPSQIASDHWGSSRRITYDHLTEGDPQQKYIFQSGQPLISNKTKNLWHVTSQCRGSPTSIKGTPVFSVVVSIYLLILYSTMHQTTKTWPWITLLNCEIWEFHIPSLVSFSRQTITPSPSSTLTSKLYVHTTVAVAENPRPYPCRNHAKKTALLCAFFLLRFRYGLALF